MDAATLEIRHPTRTGIPRQPGFHGGVPARRTRLEALGARRLKPGTLAPPRTAPTASRGPTHAVSCSP